MQTSFRTTMGIKTKAYTLDLIPFPYLTCGCSVWWQRVELRTIQSKSNHLHRLACLVITGAVRTTPTTAMEVKCKYLLWAITSRILCFTWLWDCLMTLYALYVSRPKYLSINEMHKTWYKVNFNSWLFLLIMENC